MFIQLHHAHVELGLPHVHFIGYRPYFICGLLIDVYPASCRWSYNQPQGTIFFSSGPRFSPSYFRVVGRSHEFAFTVTHDLRVTIDVVGVELTSLDAGLKTAFDVAYHTFVAGHATPGLHVVAPGALCVFFFCFLCVFFGLFRAGLSRGMSAACRIGC